MTLRGPDVTADPSAVTYAGADAGCAACAAGACVRALCRRCERHFARVAGEGRRVREACPGCGATRSFVAFFSLDYP